MDTDSYIRLRQRLDSLPNGFPATQEGTELLILRKLFTPAEAELASRLRLTLESPAQVAARVGGSAKEVRAMLKSMSQRGLIEAGRVPGGLGYGLMPFVVGIYEMQGATLDAELAELFEAYYHQALGGMLGVQPSVHRVIPVQESVRVDLAIQPYESAAQIVESMQAWGVLDCICRKQKALLGEACEHPVDICMTLSSQPGAFDNSPVVRALSREAALSTLRRAAQAGLVHSVSNNQRGVWYICNCCTCSCGILRGIAELGIANAVARSAFVNTVDETLCLGCGDCLEGCQFGALQVETTAQVDALRCLGCGVCVPLCEAGALRLERRSPAEQTPESERDWMIQRAANRGLDLDAVL